MQAGGVLSCRRRIPDTVDATMVCRLGLPLGLVVCSHRVTLAASAGGGGLPLRSRHPALQEYHASCYPSYGRPDGVSS